MGMTINYLLHLIINTYMSFDSNEKNVIFHIC